MSKIIDFERKGNVIRFYLGADTCEDYWGDDWDDRPYDCNAGTVCDEYVTHITDVAIPYDCLVLEPSSEWEGGNSNYSKKDMKKRIVPCILIVPAELAKESWDERFTHWIGADGVKKIYFGDHESVLVGCNTIKYEIVGKGLKCAKLCYECKWGFYNNCSKGTGCHNCAMDCGDSCKCNTIEEGDPCPYYEKYTEADNG